MKDWKKGFPKDSFIESKLRHAITTWNIYEGFEEGDLIKSLCGELFNIHGLLHVLLIEELKKPKEEETNLPNESNITKEFKL